MGISGVNDEPNEARTAGFTRTPNSHGIRSAHIEWRAITHLLTQAGVNVVGQLRLFQFLFCTCIVRVTPTGSNNAEGLISSIV
jgi:hypothetical protein